jgi:hypothetical protein
MPGEMNENDIGHCRAQGMSKALLNRIPASRDGIRAGPDLLCPTAFVNLLPDGFV